MKIIYEPKGRAREYAHLAANLYKGCGHGCKYCYAPGVLRETRETFHSGVWLRDKGLCEFEWDCQKLAGTKNRVLLCFTCDPYPRHISDASHTRKAIRILKQYRIPFTVLTKGGTRAVGDFDLYGPEDMFGVSMTFLDEKRSFEWEPHAASPQNRIAALEAAKQRGIRTWISLEPVIDPNQTIDIIRTTFPVCGHYRIGKLNHGQPPRPIDWRQFALMAIAECEFHGVPYYVKADLAQFLSECEYRNTDTRVVDRKEAPDRCGK